MSRAARVCVAGTFDEDVPRNRILIELLRRGGHEVSIVHVPLWERREHEIVRRGRGRLVRRALLAYPRLARRLLAAPPCSIILVGYPGHFDMPLVALLARARRARVLFDPYLSLHDTLVGDRRLVDRRSPTARLAAAVDRLSCRLADLVLADTEQNADHLATHTGVRRDRFRVLPVGAEASVFDPRAVPPEVDGRVLFYGTFIPLHGVPTIVAAAKRLEGDPVAFRIIGAGQERPAVERRVRELGVANLELVDPLPLEALPPEIARAAICLGIFGTSDKAHRVIPNKVFQCLAMRRPVLTGDTPAIRAAFAADEVARVAPGDPDALAEAIRALVRDRTRRDGLARAGHERYRRDYGPEPLSRRLASIVAELLGTGSPSAS